MKKYKKYYIIILLLTNFKLISNVKPSDEKLTMINKYEFFE